MISVKEVKQKVIDHTDWFDAEPISIDRSFERILTQDIHFLINDSSFYQSVIDGFTFKHIDLYHKTKIHLPLSTEASAGSLQKSLFGKEGMRILSEIPVLKGADIAIIQEKTKYYNDPVLIKNKLFDDISPGNDELSKQVFKECVIQDIFHKGDTKIRKIPVL